MKKILLLLVLCAICAFGQPTAQIWYQITPSPAAGSSCTGLFPGIAGLITSTGSMTCQSGVWVASLQSNVLLPGSQMQSTSATGNQPMQVCHATYSFAVDGGGAPGLITPAANCTIPANSIIINEVLDWTTAGAGTSNTTSIGTTGTGGGAAILLGATAVASLTGIVQGVIVPQTASGFKKLTTAGTVTLTTAVAALTQGIAEIYVYYITSPT